MRTVYFKKQATFKSRAKQAVKTLNIGALFALAHDIAKDYFAPYAVTCNYGTNKLCWTMAGAESWLSSCGDKAYILETYDYKILVSRTQNI